jgi:putative MATE family efflux protein
LITWISKERRQEVFKLSLPMMAGMASQNLSNLIDIFLIAYLGKDALAAVGFGSFLFLMSCAFYHGFGSAVQTIVARRIGEGASEYASKSLILSLILIFFTSIPLSILLFYITPFVMPKIQHHSAISALMIVYLQARIFSIFGMASHFTFRGFWNGLQMPKFYMNAVLMLHVINISLNALLIFGFWKIPSFGVSGIGIANSIALFFTLILYISLALKYAKPYGFTWANVKQEIIDTFTFKNIKEYQALIALSLPTSFQQFSLLAGFSVFYWIISQISAEASAAANVILNINLVGILPMMGFGMATTTLVSKSLGQKNIEMAYRWPWEIAQLSMMVILGIASLICLFPREILSIFIHEKDVIEIGVMPLRLASIWLFSEGLGLVLLHALLGAGATRSTMILALIVQWGIGLPLAYLLGVHLGYGLVGVWLAQGIFRVMQALGCAYLWKKKDWVKIKV